MKKYIFEANVTKKSKKSIENRWKKCIIEAIVTKKAVKSIKNR